MNFEAVIFDLDGTLLDTLQDIANAANAVLEDRGFPIHPPERYKPWIGKGAGNLVRRALPADRRDAGVVEDVSRAVREEYGKRWADATAPYPGVPAMLDALEARGIPFAVLSNKPHEFTMRCVERFLSRSRFAAVAGAKPDVPAKPDPVAALDIASVLGASPGAILYVGDTDTDMKTAVNAGMIPAGVLWGFRDEAELRDAGARHLLPAPSDLIALLAADGPEAASPGARAAEAISARKGARRAGPGRGRVWILLMLAVLLLPVVFLLAGLALRDSGERAVDVPKAPHHAPHAGNIPADIPPPETENEADAASTEEPETGPPASPGRRESLRALLFSEKKADRERAIDGLLSMGKEGIEALIHATMEAGANGNRRLSDRIGKALKNLDLSALPALFDIMRSPDEEVRDLAQWLTFILPKEEGPVEEAVRCLVALLEDENPGLRAHAAGLLGDFGPRARDAIPALVERLGGAEGLASEAAQSLGKIGPEAIPLLLPVLRNGTRTARLSSLSALEKMAASFGGKASAALPDLVAVLAENRDPVFRELSMYAIQCIGPTREAVPLLAEYCLDRIRDEDPERQREGFLLLFHEKMGAVRKAVVPHIVDLLRDPEEEADIRCWAACFFHGRGEDAALAIPVLLSVLGDQSRSLRESAIRTLGSFGPEARKAVPLIVEALGNEAEILRSAARGALKTICRDSIAPLLDALDHPKAAIRAGAASVLGSIGEGVVSAVPRLAERLGDEDASVRERAAEALGRMGPGARKAIPALSVLCWDPVLRVRFRASVALLKMGEDEGPLLSAFIKALGDEDPAIRRSAAKILGGLGPRAREAARSLAKSLADEDDKTAEAAAVALGRIGEKDAEILEALEKASKVMHHGVRQAATEALKKLRK